MSAPGEPGRIVHRRASIGARRHNAPIRPRPPATTVPDLLFTLGATAWTMGIAFIVASFAADGVASGDVGRLLARLFAGALLLSGFFVFALGYGLLRDERRQADHYVLPVVLGVVIGGLEALMFLWPEPNYLFAPFVLLVFAFRPIRRHLGNMLRPPRGYSR
jgi:hypothetical protein